MAALLLAWAAGPAVLAVAATTASTPTLTSALAASATPAAADGGTRCWLRGWSQAARCAVLKRPLDPARPGGPQIDLHYAVLPALARHKAEDAVFFFAGGPGQSAIELGGLLAGRFARLNQRRDLVFIDQRGTGRSAPLRCAEDEPRAQLRPLAELADETQRLPRLRVCRQALQALPHGDLRFYTTEIAMTDIDAVRQVLGLRQINAVGASYGTRAVLSYLRQFPASVRRAVLDGVAPPDRRLPDTAAQDNQAALDALLQACADAPACAARHPGLGATLHALLASLPREVVLPHPLGGRPETLMLSRDSVLALLRTPLYSPALAAALPEAIAEASAGRWAPLAALAAALGGGGGGLATGMHLSVICAEDLGPHAPATDPAELQASHAPGQIFGSSFGDFYRQACADWPRGDVSAAFYTLPRAQTPVWLLSGGVDPVTPPRHGQRVAEALGPLARHSVLPQAGHGLLGQRCVRDAVQRFIQAETDAAALAEPASVQACANALPRPPAFVPPGARP